MNSDARYPRHDPSPGPDADRSLAEWLQEQAPQREPPVLIPAVLARTALTRRRPAWLIRDWWLQLPVGRRHGVTRRLQDMPYATPFMAALVTVVLGTIVAVTGVLTGAFRSSFDAAGPPTWVVVADGSGDFTTISAAVEVAADGDAIRVRPGHYLENIRVDGKDLSIIGDGDRADIVIEGAKAPSPDPARAGEGIGGWAFYLADTDTTVSNLTVTGWSNDEMIEVTGEGSLATLDGLVIHLLGIRPDDPPEPGPAEYYPFTSVTWNAGAGGVLRDSTVEGNVNVSAGADVTIENNEMPTAFILLANQGALATIRGNVIGGGRYEFGIKVGPTIGAVSGPAGSALIEGNDISSAASGSFGTDGRKAVILGDADGEIVLRDNDVHDSVTGISVSEGSSALIEGNRVTANDVGLSIAAGATPVLTGNTVCDNGRNLQIIPADAQPPDTSGNEICPDEAATG